MKEYAEQGYTYAVTIDLSKYFDTLNHELLINLLRRNVKDERVIHLDIVSNEKSAITTKAKLKSVANHNLRKYRSTDYNRDNIVLLYGTENLYKDVQEVYYREFDEALKVYNEKQKRADRRIDDYFEHVSGLNQDMAVEIIFQCGNMEFWEEHAGKEDKMYYVYNYTLKNLMTLLPGFKVANAVIHFDEASPHMHEVGVPVHEGYKKGLSRRVVKRNVFTRRFCRGFYRVSFVTLRKNVFIFI